MLSNYRQERDSQLKVLLMAITRNPQLLVGQLILAAKLLGRRVHRAGRFVILMLLLMLIVFSIFRNRLSSDTFLEVDKCPACFGFTMCNSAKSGNVWFTGWSKIGLLDYFNYDNVYSGGSSSSSS